MSKIKVFNDPIYGLISFPFELIYELIDHRFFQRLRRISQVGLSCLVYPGAVHTRFHHALGVAHLCSELIRNLRIKKVEITDQEYEATCAAALLHDIGHGPFSHALEKQILPIHHEAITSFIMKYLNDELGGRLSLAIDIFENKYHKIFLHEMLSSQLDVDRMDYLSRDSYYTGVAEGVIGYDRIVQMMTVHDDHLAIEAKGLHSVDKFFMSRYLMYRQVYLHKAAISAEVMLVGFFKEYKTAISKEHKGSNLISKLIRNGETDMNTELIEDFTKLDDYDIVSLLKEHYDHNNFICRYFAQGLLNRRLMRTVISNKELDSDFLNQMRHKAELQLEIDTTTSSKLVISGKDISKICDFKRPIRVISSNQEVNLYSELTQFDLFNRRQQYTYVTYPKEIDNL